MTKRKILFLIESLAGGGAEKVLTTLVQHIDKEKFDVTVCAISGGGKYEEVVRKQVRYKAILNEPVKQGVMAKVLYIIKHHLVYRWLPLSWVYRLFVPQGNDVEVAYVEGFTTKLLSHSTNRNAKKYAWVHCNMGKDHWTTDVFPSIALEIAAYNRYDKIFCVSETAAQGFNQAFISVGTPVSVLYNPIDAQVIQDMAVEGNDVNKKVIRLVTVGRLEYQKGYDRLVQVVNRLVKDGIGLELWILGVGSQEAGLKEYLQKHELGDYVKLMGFHSNPYKYIVQGDLFVCSSRSEGYSTAVTEALILGLPVITTDCSGMAELLKDGECGVITKNDDEALYWGLKELITDATLLEHYRQKAIERGKDFTIESLMEPIEKLLAG